MAGQDDGIVPETLADDVPVPPLSETLSAADVDGVNGAKVSDVSVEGFDINAPLDEDDTITAVTADIEQSEIKVDTTMRLGSGGLDMGLVESEINGVSAGVNVHESLISASKDVKTGTDMGLVEPESTEVSAGVDVHESIISASKDVETTHVHGSLPSTLKDAETRLDFGLVEPKSNGDSDDTDVHESHISTLKDVETEKGIDLVEQDSKGVYGRSDVNESTSHFNTLKDVETEQDIDFVEQDSKGVHVRSYVNESASLISTPKDVETGPGFSLVEPEINAVSVVADVHESLIDTSKDVETGQRFGLVEPESNAISVDADVHGLIDPENNGVSVVADVHDVEMATEGVETDNGNGVNASASDTAVDCDIVNPRKEDLHGDSYAETDGVNEGNESIDSIEEHDYSVGDIVWGKVKSHPWWPGQIYDSSDASSDAMKYKMNGRLLVAYYGDGTFAWCLPSQLIPFAENFDDMSKQSGSKYYMNAVTKAVDEIGRLVDLAMTCTCVPEDNRKGLAGAPVVNAGIKDGVIAPVGDIGKLLSFRYDPSEILATVAITAKTVSFPNMLELSILKGCLSSFYRAKGGFSLPRYHEPIFVEGLEDKSKTSDVGAADVRSVHLQGPVEEECGSFVNLLKNIVNRRKQRSVAELIASGTDTTTPENRKREGIKAVSNSANKKRKASEEDGSCSGDIFQDRSTRTKQVRKDDDKMSAEYGISSEKKKQESSLKVDIPDGDSKLFEEKFSPRERKKSKYLSPPYTSPHSRVGYPSYKDEDRETPKVGERMTKVDAQLLDSAPLECNGERDKKQDPVVYSREKAFKSAEIIPKTGKKDNIYAMDVMNAEVEEVLSGGLKSIAAGPMFSVSESVIELTRAFITAFRSSIYSNGESYEFYHKRQPSKTTETVNFELEDRVNGSIRTGIESPGGQTKGKKRIRNSETLEKSGEKKSDTPKPKRAARCSTKKFFFEGVEKSDVPLASSLVLTFDPTFPLPSKVEIIDKFSKFGNINENETDVFSESGNAKIVYMKGGCVEAALRVSLCQSPFFSGIVDYKLCYTQKLQ